MGNLLKILVFTFLFSSCAVKNYHTYNKPNEDPRYKNFFQLGVDDIQELGETEISYEFSRYAFLLPRLIGINGEAPDNSEKHYAYVGGNSLFGERTSSLFDLDGGGLRRALYKAYLEFPEADYMHIIYTKEQTHRMFLGRKIKRTSKVKAYKFRDSK